MANHSSVPQHMKQVETDVAVLQVRFTNLDEKVADIRVTLGDIQEDIEDMSDKSATKMDSVITKMDTMNDNLSNRIVALERLKWMGIGAIFVVSAFGTFFGGLLSNKFF